MTRYFFDTSSTCKHYHAETGSAKESAMLAAPGKFIISRLGYSEFHAAFAKKCRIGHITRADYERITRRFRKDVAAKRFEITHLTVVRLRSAERLISRIGPTLNLRTLDAMQLAVALSLDDPITFVCADQALCTIAAAEGLVVVNPELP